MLTEELYNEAVNAKLGNDMHLRSELAKAFTKVKDEAGTPTKSKQFKISMLDVKLILGKILRREMLNFTA